MLYMLILQCCDLIPMFNIHALHTIYVFAINLNWNVYFFFKIDLCIFAINLNWNVYCFYLHDPINVTM